MYAKVPVELREIFLKDIQRVRRNSFLKTFPALLAICAGIVALAVFFKGHYLVELLREIFGDRISDTTFLEIVGAGIIIFTACALIYFLRQDYSQCKLENYLFCPLCNAVDNYEEGHCPKCSLPVTEKACFIYTSYKEEKNVINRWGLQIFEEAKSPSLIEKSSKAVR